MNISKRMNIVASGACLSEAGEEEFWALFVNNNGEKWVKSLWARDIGGVPEGHVYASFEQMKENVFTLQEETEEAII